MLFGHFYGCNWDHGYGKKEKMKLDVLYNEDCLGGMKRLPNESIDLIITSPPYDNLRTYGGYVFKFEEKVKELYRIIKIGGVVVWVVGDETINFNETGSSFKQALFFKDIGFNLLDTMIWQKPNYAPMYPSVMRYDNNFEYMFVISKGKPKTFNPIKDIIKKESSKQRSKYARSYIKKNGSRIFKEKTNNESNFCKRNIIWKIPNGQLRGLNHPAVFPEQLAEDHILSWSNEGDIILDPMCGSGTTLKMAKKNHRYYIGFEINPEYCDITRKRLSEVQLELIK